MLPLYDLGFEIILDSSENHEECLDSERLAGLIGTNFNGFNWNMDLCRYDFKIILNLRFKISMKH
jgi:hypothetical protein